MKIFKFITVMVLFYLSYFLWAIGLRKLAAKCQKKAWRMAIKADANSMESYIDDLEAVKKKKETP